MKRYLIAAITCIALTVGVSPAAASGGLGGVVQTVTGTSQQNTNTSGDASASNGNGTWQSNDQSQKGYGGDASTGDATTGGKSCCGSSGDATSGDATGGDVSQSQNASNSNETTQNASAESKAEQTAPVNAAVPVCVALHCESGGVEQSNTNRSGDAAAGNVNHTGQSNEQSQKGVGGDATTGDATTGGGSGDATSGDATGGDVSQSQNASNSNETTQNASAVSEAKQVEPVNVAVPVCVALSCQSGGVEQSNTNRSGDAAAGNVNHTGQSNEQSQKGVGGDATTGDATTGGGSGDATSGDATGGDVSQSQNASNSNETTQNAAAESKAEQIAPVNVAVPVCVALHCKSGGVEQSNTNRSGDAWAGNKNHTGQSNEQSQKGVGGDATSGDATAGGGCCKHSQPTKPSKPCEKPSYGSKTKSQTPCEPEHNSGATSGDATGGDVSQSQNASNSNETTQNASAVSEAKQVEPVNVAVPVCVAFACKSGKVEQSNTNRSGDASASNSNGTWQSNHQGQSGYGGDATTGDATTGGGCCTHPKPTKPCEKPSYGSKTKSQTPCEPEHNSGATSGDATSGDATGGDVSQSQNASNSNETTQNASAKSKAKQIAPVNVAVPVCVALHCKSGGVEQSNTNRSGDAWAGNKNHTGQSNEQSQKGVGGDATSGDATAGGGCCKHSQPTKPSKPCEKPSYGSKTKSQTPCEPEHNSGATSGDATGGDVSQSQNASNSNETTQNAYAKSKAKQEGALNLILLSPPKPAPNGCKAC